MFLINNSKFVKIIGIVFILVQTFIDYMLNWIPTGKDFTINALFSSVAFWVLLISILIYIYLYSYLNFYKNKTIKIEKNKLEQALDKNGVYDTYAKTVGKCMEENDYKRFKNLRKMAKML